MVLPCQLANKWIKLLEEKQQQTTWVEKFSRVVFLGWVNMGLCVEQKGTNMQSHTPHKDKGYWDRKWIMSYFHHGHPSINVLSSAKNQQIQKHTDGDKQAHRSRYKHAFLNTLENTPFSFKCCGQQRLWEQYWLFFITSDTFTSVSSGGALSKWNLSVLPISQK